MKTIDRLVDEVTARYAIETPDTIVPLTGGEWKTLWRLQCGVTSYVLSMSHPTTAVASVAYEHRLLRYLGQRLAPIPAPIPTRNGATYFVAQGQIFTLLPFMRGEMAGNNEDGSVAARFLAQFQQVALGYPDRTPRPGVSPWHVWDWHASTWPKIQQMLVASPHTTDPAGTRFWQGCGEWAAEVAERRRQITEERSYFQRWLADRHQSTPPLTTGLVHDDYHGNNLLIADGAITALLDWDSCHPDWLLFDLSNALWEYCHDDGTHTLIQSEAETFLHAYIDAGGPIPASEYPLLIPLIRCRRLIEIMSSLNGIATATTWDESPDYLVHNLRSLENLREVTL